MLIMFNIDQFYYGYAFIWIFKYKKNRKLYGEKPKQTMFPCMKSCVVFASGPKSCVRKIIFFLGVGWRGLSTSLVPTTSHYVAHFSNIFPGVVWGGVGY